MEKVVLFKSPENSCSYVDMLESNEYTSVFIPVLEFVFTNLDLLLLKMKDHDRYDGLVITSPRAIDAVKKCLNGSSDILEHWKKKLIFVVGEATGRELLSDLNLSACDVRPGNANALADYIIQLNQKDTFNKALLFPCGNLKSEVLPTRLRAEKIGLESLDVYTTQMHHGLKDSILNLKLKEGIPSNLIFFSPSGVGFVVPILKDIGYNFDESKIIAFGPSTGKKIIELGLNLFGIAEEPSPSAICDCLGRLNKNFEAIDIK